MISFLRAVPLIYVRIFCVCGRESTVLSWTKWQTFTSLSDLGAWLLNLLVINMSCGGGGLVTKSCLTLAIPWSIACQVPLSMGFSRNTGVGCHFLPERIFPTQESNPGLLHCWQILYRLNYDRNPLTCHRKEFICFRRKMPLLVWQILLSNYYLSGKCWVLGPYG